MAEIQVEPKRGLGWVWALVLLVIVALIVWYFVAQRGTAPAADTALGALPLLAVRRRLSTT